MWGRGGVAWDQRCRRELEPAWTGSQAVSFPEAPVQRLPPHLACEAVSDLAPVPSPDPALVGSCFSHASNAEGFAISVS